METLKMRRLSLMTPLAALALLFAAPQTGEAQTGLKIGYIISAALYDEAPGAQAAQQQEPQPR